MAARTAAGRLVFYEPVAGQTKPMINTRVELWDLDVEHSDQLAHAITDSDGRFEFAYDPADAGWYDTPDLFVRVMEDTYTYSEQGDLVVQRQVAYSSPPQLDVDADHFDFGDIAVAYWEYATDDDCIISDHVMAFTPRVAAPGGALPQNQSTGWKVARNIEMAKHAPTFFKHKLINRLDEDRPDTAEIEADYPSTRVRSDPEHWYGDGGLVDLVLNGFSPTNLERNEQGEYYVAYRWNGVEQDGVHFAPNTTAYFAMVDGALAVDRIEIERRVGNGAAADCDYHPATTHRPGDPDWDAAKRLFRCNYFVFGEAFTHLAGTHLNLEQYAIAFMRNLRLNPVRWLILPHFQGTIEVNYDANNALVKDIIPKDSALTPESFVSLLAAGFHAYNWAGWAPRQPVQDDHQYARAGQLFWQVVEDHVREFFATHDKEIRRHWLEIRNMSDELVAHALPYQADRGRWADASEINTPDLPHPVIDGVARAVSPVTTSDQPDEADLENLKQLCRYLIFVSTFMHSWINDRQYELGGGDIEFFSLGLLADVTDPAADTTSLVPALEQSKLHLLTWLLEKTQYGYLVRNEMQMVDPSLIRRLVERDADFQALGFDIRDVRSCVNT